MGGAAEESRAVCPISTESQGQARAKSLRCVCKNKKFLAVVGSCVMFRHNRINRKLELRVNAITQVTDCYHLAGLDPVL